MQSSKRSPKFLDLNYYIYNKLIFNKGSYQRLTIMPDMALIEFLIYSSFMIRIGDLLT